MSNICGPGGKDAGFSQRLAALGLREEDLVETFTHSGGPGGQNVNKTSTAVVLTHRPSGLQVRCEQERSQARNRVLARQLLLDKIASKRQAAVAAERAAKEKNRRQKRPRSRAAKERILQNKAKQSVKKRLRRTSSDD